MQLTQVLYEVADNVATITLNRPERLNAWTPVMDDEVHRAFVAAAAAPDVRAILLTGSGKGFCGGLDLDCLASTSASTGSAIDPPIPPREGGRFAYLRQLPKPIIAAINGPAAGAGLALALFCDVRLAVKNVVLTTAFARRGLTAEHGIAWLLPRLIGMGPAMDLLLSGRKLGGDEASSMGLINGLYDGPTELVNASRRYALDLARHCSPRSMRIMKSQLWAAQEQSLSEAVASAHLEMLQSFGSEDFREGVAHLREKRAPIFPS